MKKVLLILSMVFSIASYAQEENKGSNDSGSEVKTLFPKKDDDSKRYISGWGGLSTSYQMINGKAGYANFGRGGVLINHKYTIGIGGAWGLTAAEQNKALSDNLKFYTTASYGGFLLGYELKPLEPIHLSFSLLLGTGYVLYEVEDIETADHSYEEYEKDYYEKAFDNTENNNLSFVARPSIGVDMNISKWFRLGLEAAYIISSSSPVSVKEYGYPNDPSIEVIKKNGLSGFTGGVSFKFGVF